MKDKKVVLQSLLCFALVVSLILPVAVAGASPAGAQPSAKVLGGDTGIRLQIDGTGPSSSSGVEIQNWYDLDAIRDNLSGSYVLMSDLDYTTPGYEELAGPDANAGMGWMPIGTDDDRFAGILDGQGYEIRGLFANRPDERYVGLFGWVAEDGFIDDIGITDVAVNGYINVGSLIGRNQGTVTNSHSSGNVTGEYSVGGLTGYSERTLRGSHSTACVTGFSNVGGLIGVASGFALGSVSNCYFAGSVTGEYSVGGVVGQLHSGFVSNSYSKGSVSGQSMVGGLVGWHSGGTVSNCYSIGSVTAGHDVGGLVGDLEYGIVENSYSAGSVSGEASVGGLVGDNAGTVTNSHSSGNVSGDSSVGGLVGSNYGTVRTCHSMSNVVGDRNVGGLVGWAWEGSVSDSYCTGSVSGRLEVGGLLGRSYRTSISNCHYNFDEVLINGENMITTGALYDEDFQEWIANDRFLDINERLSREAGYYLIKDVCDFKQLLAFGQDSSLKFRLKGDLELGNDPNLYIPYLAGEFDGNGHIIRDLSFHFDFVSNVGLFGYLAGSGRLAHVTGEQATITGYRNVGGLVGYSDGGAVSDSYFNATVTGSERVGGLVGCSLLGTVTNSYSSGRVIGDIEVGGLVGVNWASTVSNAYSTASVTGDSHVGGLLGVNTGAVDNSYSSGSITGYSSVGGLVGENKYSGTVIDSFWDVEISGQSWSDGGTGKTTAEMKDISTFTDTATEGLDEPWHMTAVVSGTANHSYTWNIVDGQTYPFLSWEKMYLVAISTADLPEGQVGMAYEVTLQATGGTEPYTWGITGGVLPPGLGLDDETGVIFGTPIEAGTFNFTVEVTDDEGLTASRLLTIIITEWDPWVYDENSDGVIQKMEALQAVQDYFAEKIAKAQVLEVIQLYFAG